MVVSGWEHLTSIYCQPTDVCVPWARNCWWAWAAAAFLLHALCPLVQILQVPISLPQPHLRLFCVSVVEAIKVLALNRDAGVLMEGERGGEAPLFPEGTQSAQLCCGLESALRELEGGGGETPLPELGASAALAVAEGRAS